MCSKEFTTLYRQHRFAVYRRCRHLLDDDAEAHDMTQNVFMQLLRAPDRFAGRARLSTYLYVVATNLCLNWLRHRRIRDTAWQEALAAHVGGAARSIDPEHALATQQIIQGILAEQDETTALLALYYFVDGLKQAEIGKLVGLSRVSVNQRLRHFAEDTRAQKARCA